MTTIPTTEPASITKGDSLSWRKVLPQYPASDGWVLTYHFRGAASLNITATADDDAHLVILTTTNTDTLTAGDYAWAAKVAKDSTLITIATGNLTVLPDIADQSAGYEARPHCKIMLDAIEAVLQGKASQDVSSYSIQGRSLTRMSADELEKWRDKYRSEWAKYQRKQARKNGKQVKRKIQVRFTR